MKHRSRCTMQRPVAIDPAKMQSTSPLSSLSTTVTDDHGERECQSRSRKTSSFQAGCLPAI